MVVKEHREAYYMDYLYWVVSAQILLVTVLLFVGMILYGFRRKLPCAPLTVLTAGTAISVVLLCWPVNLDTGLWSVLQNVWVTIYNTMRFFSMGSDYDDLKKFAMENFTKYQQMLVCYMSFLRLFVAMITLSNVLSFFRNIRGNLQFATSGNRTLYILSALNPNSVTIAESISEHGDADRLIVFTNVTKSVEENNQELFDRAKNIGALCLKKDITQLDISGKKAKVEFFLVNEDEGLNLEHAVKLTQKHKDAPDLAAKEKQKNTCDGKKKHVQTVTIYLYSNSPAAQSIVDSLDKGKYLLNHTFLEKARNDTDNKLLLNELCDREAVLGSFAIQLIDPIRECVLDILRRKGGEEVIPTATENMLKELMHKLAMDTYGITVGIHREDAEALAKYTGLSSAEGILEAAFHEVAQSTRKYSLALVKIADGTDADSIADAMKNGIKPELRYYDIQTAVNGKYVLLVQLEDECNEELSSQTIINTFKNIANDSVNGEIPIVVVGHGSFGRQFVKSAAWFYQLQGNKVKIYVFDKNPDAEKLLRQECPELISRSGRYEKGEAWYDIRCFSGTDCFTSDFDDIVMGIPELKHARLVFVALGSDDANIMAATRIRVLFNQLQRNRPDYGSVFPKIHAVIRDDQLVKNMESRNLRNTRGESAEIIFEGTYSQQYSYAVCANLKQLEHKGFLKHIGWQNVTAYTEKYRQNTELYSKYSYYRDTSISRVLHEEMLDALMKARPGLDINRGDTEHMRWNAYMRSIGYRYHTETIHSAKLHCDLIPRQELSSEEQLKDEEAVV